MGRLILIVVIVVLVVGLLSPVIYRLPFLGKLPGDFSWQRKGVTYYFPLGSSILLSIVLTLLVNWLIK
jgi:hypothetical protein